MHSLDKQPNLRMPSRPHSIRNRSVGRPRPIWRCFALLVLPAALVGCDQFRKFSTPPPAPRVQQPQKNLAAIALGRIAPAGSVISIPATPGERVELLDPDIVVNEKVPANGIIGKLGSYRTRKSQLDSLDQKRDYSERKYQLDIRLSAARLQAARAQLAQAKAKQQEAILSQGRLSVLKESSEIAGDDLRQLMNLAQRDPQLVTPQQLRRQTNENERAATDLRIAEESYEPTLAAATAAVEAAEANLEAAQETLSQLDVMNPVYAIDLEIKLGRQALAESILWAPNVDRAQADAYDIEFVDDPQDAVGPFTVLKVHVPQGSYVAHLPVLQLADLSQMVCIAEVYEADAKKLSQDQPVTIKSKAFSGEFEKGIPATVERISQVIASPGLRPRNPMAPVDRSVVEVRVKIDEDNKQATAEAAKWIGLQVTVEFENQ